MSPGRSAPANRILPWYRPQRPDGETPHAGLLFDRFCNQWQASGKLEGPEKHFFFESLGEAYRGSEKSLKRDLEAARAQRKRLVKEVLGGRCVPFRTTSRLITGLGMTHALETGFLWHPTLGIPYLPGSSVKGLIRAWFDPDEGWAPLPPSQAEKDRLEQARRLFGGSDGTGVGALVVFEALPVSPPTIDIDIMNVHYKPYYQDGDAPSDYSEPTLIYFLAVAAGAEFEFALAPRPGSRPALGSAENDLATGFELLRDALEVLGAGAKTAAGYGRMTRAPSQ